MHKTLNGRMGRSAIGLLVALAISACGAEPAGGAADAAVRSDAAASRDGSDGASALCVGAAECSDGVFCNGPERCKPDDARADARGCAPAAAAACTAGQLCVEGMQRCAEACASGDRTDLDRYVGNAERCDGTRHDEDCDPCTVATNRDGDGDGDGFLSSACCNAVTAGATATCAADAGVTVTASAVCGTDCDDRVAGVHPGAPEVCNGVDDDCDGTTDNDPSAAAACRAVHPTQETRCERGACSVGACLPMRGDCDGAAANGCEADLATSAQHCGACGRACGAGGTCVAGVCDRVVHLAAGGAHSCALRAGGQVVCWGDNRYGQLGDGTTVNRDGATAVVGLTDAVEIVAGLNHTCARRRLGEVVCWGDNREAVGLPPTAPVVVPLPTPPVELTASGTHTCARTASGRVDCWGDGDWGVLGIGPIIRENPCISTLFSCPVLVDAVEIAAGKNRTCARRAAGTVMCWGQAHGASYARDPLNDWVPRAQPGLSDAVEISVGGRSPSGDSGQSDFACARRADGSVLCWGDSPATGAYSAVPLAVAGLSDAVELAAGGRYACARRTGGGVSCWGIAQHGEFGGGTIPLDPPIASETPVPVVGLADAVEIAAGLNHTCALRASGAVVCWGFSDFGRLGDGTSGVAPMAVRGLTDAVELGAGEQRACARRASGSVVCWGSGFLGNRALREPGASIPVPVVGLTDAARLTVSRDNACVCRSSGAVACWGQIEGAGGNTTDPLPVEVAGITDAVAVATESSHRCVIRRSGTVLCWGRNSAGELGDGTQYTTRVAPVAVTGLSGVTAIGVSNHQTCALGAGGAVSCWGEDLGSRPTVREWTTPQAIPALAGSTGLSMGFNNYVTTLHADGTVAFWPAVPLFWRDGFGGDRVGVDVREYRGGSNHSCVRRSTGRVTCGDGTGAGRVNQHGELGAGASGERVVNVPGITDAVEIAIGLDFTCVRRATGGVSCWGASARGQLGHGFLDFRATPVSVVGL